jgi:hypothetical protein
MLKNLFLLGLLTWVTLSYARPDYSIHHESLADAEAYKVEKPVHEQEAKRGVAGSKIKKKKPSDMKDEPSTESSETGSEVRYWQYSE